MYQVTNLIAAELRRRSINNRTSELRAELRDKRKFITDRLTWAQYDKAHGISVNQCKSIADGFKDLCSLEILSKVTKSKALLDVSYKLEAIYTELNLLRSEHETIMELVKGLNDEEFKAMLDAADKIENVA